MAKKKATKTKATAAMKVTRKKSAKTPTKKKTAKKKLAKKSAVKKQAKKKSGVKKKTTKKAVQTRTKKATTQKKVAKKAAARPKTVTKRKSAKATSDFRRFELVDGKSSKFWEISLNGSEFTVRYGRIGTDGQAPKTKDMGTSEKAAAEVEKLIRAKAGKGYAETANTAGTTGVSEKASRKKAVKKKASGKKAATFVFSAKLEKAIEKDFQACEELLRKGTGRNEWVTKNCKRMKSWQEAAQAGDARGQVLYGLCFYYGSGVKKNEKTAVKWFTKAAEQGNAEGQFSLGQCFYYGEGVKEDKKTAVEWFTKAAEQGNADGQAELTKHILTKEKARAYRPDDMDQYRDCEEIEDAAAELLSKRRGKLFLDGLTTLSDTAAAWLSEFEGAYLGLYGLTDLTTKAARSLAKARVNELTWGDGVPEKCHEILRTFKRKTLTEELAAEIVGDGEDNLDDFSSIEDGAAQILSEVDWSLYLRGISHLTDTAAKHLSQYAGDELSLTGLTELSEVAAGHLSRSKAEFLELSLGKVPQHVASVLRRHPSLSDG